MKYDYIIDCCIHSVDGTCECGYDECDGTGCCDYVNFDSETEQTMTNEEKAREIAREKSQSYGFGLNYDSSVECYESALAMAEWKDENRTPEEYLTLKNFVYAKGYAEGYNKAKKELIDRAYKWWYNFHNESFNKYMCYADIEKFRNAMLED